MTIGSAEVATQKTAPHMTGFGIDQKLCSIVYSRLEMVKISTPPRNTSYILNILMI